MRWLLAILSVIIGAVIGFCLSYTKKRRLKNLNEIYTMCNIISQNICFTRDKLSIILQNTIKTVDKDMKAVIGALTVNLSDDETTLREKLSNECRKIGLKTEESVVTASCLAALGRTDAETQKKILANSASEIDSFRKRANEEYRKNSKLYLELGTLLGIGVGILIL